VKTKKNVLIITDGSEETVKIAAVISDALKDHKVTVKPAPEFKGNDILPVDAFFLGCEKPEPESFAYLADLLKHINLAGRPCGVFSPGSAKAARYLSALVKDSEAALNPEPLFLNGSDSSPINSGKWAEKVISGSF
jgi:hypothetical protein